MAEDLRITAAPQGVTHVAVGDKRAAVGEALTGLSKAEIAAVEAMPGVTTEAAKAADRTAS